MLKYSLLSFISVFLLSCNTTNETEKKIAAINLDYEMVYFHKEYFSISDERELNMLKKKYPFLFPLNVPNTFWLNKINDEKALYQIVDSTYNNLSELKNNTTLLYKHLKHYYPGFQAPKTFTVISNIDYNTPVIYADSLAFIALDMYLGKKSIVYSSFPKYIANNYRKERINVDLAQQVILSKTKLKRNRNFLSNMLYHGKLLYLNKLVNPTTPEYIILGMTEEKYAWCLKNEMNIWKYFVSNNLLFENDNSLSKRFIDTAPFSKFYLSNDKDSPGGVGKFIGYQIVKSYAENNNFTIEKLQSLEENILLKNSKYKPKR